MTAVPPSWVVRLRRLLWPAGNPLARGVDRVEGTVLLLAVLLALVLVPVMLTFGSLTYESLAERSEQQSGSRYQTVAVLTRDAPEPSTGMYGEVISGTSKVPARWQLSDGTTRTGRVETDDGLKAGAEVPIWLDESGEPVDPPLSTVDIVGAGVLVAVFGWLTAVGLLAFACGCLHHVLGRHRYRAWQAEWARVEPDWHDRSR
jgi:hypothetical protein